MTIWFPQAFIPFGLCVELCRFQRMISWQGHLPSATIWSFENCLVSWRLDCHPPFWSCACGVCFTGLQFLETPLEALWLVLAHNVMTAIDFTARFHGQQSYMLIIVNHAVHRHVWGTPPTCDVHRVLCRCWQNCICIHMQVHITGFRHRPVRGPWFDRS